MLVKILTTFSALFFLAVSSFSYAHPGGHGGAIPEDEAVLIATKQISRLVEAEKLASSWELSRLKTVEMRELEEANEYVVTFSNSKVADPAKATLYIFLTEAGEYLAANFNGQ